MKENTIAALRNGVWMGHFHDGVIYYNYQNPSVCCFFLKIRDTVIYVSAEITKFKQERKNGEGVW